MPEMISFQPKQTSSIIKVLGVGGGGSNAVNHMFKQGIKGVDFAICNTDLQALQDSPVPVKIEIGSNGGLGAGSKPEVGRNAAEESLEKIKEVLSENTQMLFVTAGMGGGTGTGAAPVIAKLAMELGILTVGIITLPFQWEGRRRSLQALEGVEEMKKNVDTLLVINNDKLRIQFGNLSVKEAFAKADNVLTIAAKGIAEIITATGKVNTDFEDVKTVIKKSGKAIMGQAVAEGENRAMNAIEEAMNSPLLNDNDITGATNILLHIVSGTDDITMDEISEITEFVQTESGNEADVIWGLGEDESLGNNIGITVIATGFDSPRENIEPKHKKLIDLYPKKVKETKTVGAVEEQEESTEATEMSDQTEAEKEFFAKKEEEVSEIHLINKPIVKHELETDTKADSTKIVYDLNSDKSVNKEQDKSKESDTFTLLKHPEKTEVGPIDEKQTFENKTLEETTIEENESIKKNAEERVSKLKSMSMSFRVPGKLNELETQPAYLRKNIDLTEAEHSSQSVVSRHTLGEDTKSDTVIKSDNSFLHDNVD